MVVESYTILNVLSNSTAIGLGTIKHIEAKWVLQGEQG